MEPDVEIKLPGTDLKSVQGLGSIELKDERGGHVGQYFFGNGQGRTVFLLGSTRARSKPTLSVKLSSMA